MIESIIMGFGVGVGIFASVIAALIFILAILALIYRFIAWGAGPKGGGR